MSNTELNHFQKALEDKRREIESIRVMREDIAVESSGDEVERLQLASERDVAIHRFENKFTIARRVEDAFQRLQDGTFGVCERCGDDIAPKRLKAVPWTEFCVACQTTIELESAATGEFTHDAFAA